MPKRKTKKRDLILRGVRQHNLKGFDLVLPQDRFIVVTGVSGSGKSSLAFDTCYAEGQRRYMESLSTYARQFLERMPRPDVDSVENLYPAIALAQHNPVRTQRSTVATATEVHDHLRLLWARAGTTLCSRCGRPVRPGSVSSALETVMEQALGERVFIGFPVRRRGGEHREAWAERMRRHGFLRLRVGDEVFRLGESALPPVGRLDRGAVVVDRLVVREAERARLSEALETALEHGLGWARVEVVDGATLTFCVENRCPDCDLPVAELQPALFSFNSPLGACPECRGFGEVLEYSEALVVPNPDRTLAQGAVAPWQTPHKKRWQGSLEGKAGDLGVDLHVPWRALPEEARRAVWEGKGRFGGVLGFFKRLERKKYKVSARMLVRRYQENRTCPRCEGTRLVERARRVVLEGRGIHEVVAMAVAEARPWADGLELPPGPGQACAEALRQIRFRLEALERVGLGYLTLDRPVRTLSSGEHQRLSLARQLGSALTGTLYVLDEPTVGLHPRDTERLLAILEELSRRGNTVLVVEHDPAVIRRADHLVELGPEAGERGGELIFSGPLDAFVDGEGPEGSRTAGYLRGEWGVPLPEERRLPGAGRIRLEGCRGHNLKSVDLDLPLGLLVAVSGVSGSGKTTLVRHTLHAALARSLQASPLAPQPYDALTGAHYLDDVVLLDQDPVGRTPRSNPATFLKAMEEIRKVFAGLPVSRREGLRPGHFSFNAGKGRCPVCKGEGRVRVEMHFLEDLHLTCEVCNGTRYRERVLAARYKGLNIAQVLDLTVDEAADLFRHQKGVCRRLAPLREVGLGYLRLGQPAPTLSGGESQRLKIAATLARRARGHALYILDEPTTGLHPWDVRVLLEVLNRLVDEGNTVLVVEHDLDVLKAADWIVDLGPEAGDEGGRIVAEGSPEQVARSRKSITARFLRQVL